MPLKTPPENLHSGLYRYLKWPSSRNCRGKEEQKEKKVISEIYITAPKHR